MGIVFLGLGEQGVKVAEFCIEHLGAFVDLQRQADRSARQCSGEMCARRIGQGGSGGLLHRRGTPTPHTQVQVAKCVVTGTIGDGIMRSGVSQHARATVGNTCFPASSFTVTMVAANARHRAVMSVSASRLGV